MAPETPGSIHEGGELGYALAHAYGAAFDNPDLVVACVVGDGEAETGPLAASWHSNKFLDPARDGAVLPILHLNGYKIANPTVLARIPEDELVRCSRATATGCSIVAGDDPPTSTASWPPPSTRPRRDRRDPAARPQRWRPATGRRWPMIVLRTPEGLDRAAGGRRPCRSRARGAPTRCPLAGVRTEPRAPPPARGVDAQLPARRAVRRRAARRGRSSSTPPRSATAA